MSPNNSFFLYGRVTEGWVTEIGEFDEQALIIFRRNLPEKYILKLNLKLVAMRRQVMQ